MLYNYINLYRMPETSLNQYSNYMNNSAIAFVKGGSLAPNIRGYVLFVSAPGGLEITIEVSGLPYYKPSEDGKQPIGPYGFHLHDMGSCEENISEPFKSAGGHYNPTSQPHGNHFGDFPVVFSNDGYSKMSFYTNRLSIEEILGKSVIIHENPDDYRTQPAGNSGKRIACGVVRPMVCLNRDLNFYNFQYPYNYLLN